MPPPQEASTSALPMSCREPTPCTRPLPRRLRRRYHTSKILTTLLLALILLHLTSAQVTVYTGIQTPTTTVTSRAADATWTGLPVYDPLQLVPPPPPSPAVTAVNIPLPPNPAALIASNLSLSIPQKGNFLGFSVELSVADTLMGPSGDHLRPEFLNYLNNIQVRAGAGPVIRVGGNTQDNSTIYPQGFSDGKMIEKIREVGTGPTVTPWINYSPMLLYVMANVSRLTHAEWYFGLAFNYTDALLDSHNIPLAASYAQRILGRNLRGLALGNEPDLYTDHGDRPAGWTINNYTQEWTTVSQSVIDSNSLSYTDIFVGPSVCCNRVGFELPDIINTGWLSENSNKLAQISVQHYPNNNCQLNGQPIDPQSIFPEYLNHTSAQSLTAQYAADSAAVANAGKELVMLEMNTASCGGFPGLSTSFGAALWMTDWALQLASYNFSTALMHVGGQNVYYNPFTPPPGNLTNIYQWTTGSVYYSTLLIAEIFGQSNKSRVADLNIQGENAMFHPAYAVYEDDAPSRVVLFNYVNDPSGASTYTATIPAPGSNTVHVRYFSAPSISEHSNITWAGQTMGLSYASDGRLHGNVSTTTITCQNSQCQIPVAAPAIAVVYLSDQALTLSSPPVQGGTAAFETTRIGFGSATVDPKVMETSNGQNGPDGQLGRNNKATSGAEREVRVLAGIGAAAVVVVIGAVLGGLEKFL